METTERWLPVVGYEGLYEVSDHGRARSLDRLTPQVIKGTPTLCRYRGRILTIPTPKGALRDMRVNLYRNGQATRRSIHALVLEAFVGPRPDGLWALHWDDNHQNNRLENLRWGTPRDNVRDSVRNGVNGQAKKTHCKYGHEYTPENTQYLVGPTNGTDGRSRRCATCHREDEAARKRKKRGMV